MDRPRAARIYIKVILSLVQLLGLYYCAGIDTVCKEGDPVANGVREPDNIITLAGIFKGKCPQAGPGCGKGNHHVSRPGKSGC